MMIMIINFGLAFNQTISELRTYQIAHYTDHTSSVVCMLSATPRNAHFLQMCVGLFLICCIPISIPPLSSLYLPVSPPPLLPSTSFMFQLTFNSHYYCLCIFKLLMFLSICFTISFALYFFLPLCCPYCLWRTNNNNKKTVIRLFVRLCNTMPFKHDMEVRTKDIYN